MGTETNKRKMPAEVRAKLSRSWTPEMRAAMAQRVSQRRSKYPSEVVTKVLETLKTQPELKGPQVAAMHGVDLDFIQNLKTKHGMAKIKRTDPATCAKILEALRAQEQKRTIKGDILTTIAKQFGVAYGRVQTIQDKAGIRFRKKWRPFMEAREWARTEGARLGINCGRLWVQSRDIPEDVPRNVELVYEDEWQGWYDFLGTSPRWDKDVIVSYLKDIQSLLPQLSDADVLKLLREAGLLPRLGNLLSNQGFAGILASLRRGDLPEISEEDHRSDDDNVFESDYKSPDIAPSPHLPDRMKNLRASSETIQHIIEGQLAILRAKWFRDGVPPVLDNEGGEFFKEIKRRFEEEVAGVQSLKTPWWCLQKDGKLVDPSPMQKYVAWKLQSNRVLGNWSGTGAGKTDSAGLAAHSMGATLTLVLAANSTVTGWKEQLEETFPNCRVFTRMREVQRGPGCFLILNYERFQIANARVMAEKIIALHPEFVVLDEVQLVKQRGGEASNRSLVIRELLAGLPGAKVLGMSATPVINELREGISLLEAITQETSTLKTKANINNALDLFAALRRIGVRYIPKYEQTEQRVILTAQRDDLLRDLQQAEDILPIEQTLLPSKLELVRDRIAPGTLLYLEYTDGLVPVVRTFVQSLGYRVGEYTGDADTLERENIKKQFIAGGIDVLVGSRAISVGVDGLQQRCSKLIFLSLPWTHAAFTQVVGRVYRQGGKSNVEVIIPQIVVSNNGNRWSWDEVRLKRIEYKRTLGECATDGVIPTSAFSEDSRRTLVVKAISALNKLFRRAATV